MRFSIMGSLALLSFALFVPAAVGADPVADQKKVYKALGLKIPHPPAMCNLLTKSEVSSAIGKPVGNGESAGAAAGCAYRATDGSNDGVLVIRQARSDWYESTHADQYHPVNGVGEKAYTAYEAGLGYEANVLSANGVTNVQISGKASAETALALAKIAMKR